jgi:hypothetical protein
MAGNPGQGAGTLVTDMNRTGRSTRTQLQFLTMAYWLLVAGVSTGAILEDPAPDRGFEGRLVVALCLGFVWRLWRAGVVLGEDEVVLQGPFLRKRIPCASGDKFVTASYSGQLNWDGRSGFWMMLRFKGSADAWDLPIASGTSRRMERVCASLNDQLALAQRHRTTPSGQRTESEGVEK